MHLYLSEIQQQDYKDHICIIQLSIGRTEQPQLDQTILSFWKSFLIVANHQKNDEQIIQHGRKRERREKQFFLRHFNKKFQIHVMMSWKCEKGLTNATLIVLLPDIISIITIRIQSTVTVKDIKLDAIELWLYTAVISQITLILQSRRKLYSRK